MTMKDKFTIKGCLKKHPLKFISMIGRFKYSILYITKINLETYSCAVTFKYKDSHGVLHDSTNTELPLTIIKDSIENEDENKTINVSDITFTVEQFFGYRFKLNKYTYQEVKFNSSEFYEYLKIKNYEESWLEAYCIWENKIHFIIPANCLGII